MRHIQDVDLIAVFVVLLKCLQAARRSLLQQESAEVAVWHEVFLGTQLVLVHQIEVVAFLRWRLGAHIALVVIVVVVEFRMGIVLLPHARVFALLGNALVFVG